MTEPAPTPKAIACADLRRAILLLEIAPGTPLDEAGLCTRYGMSRTPLREVMQQLAGEGYIAQRQNRGAQVSDMSHKTLRDFFLAAPMIYGAVLQLAATNATPQQLRDLKAAQRDFRAALAAEDVADRTLANDRFHRVTGEMADNLYLLPSFHRLLIDHARIGMTFFRAHSETRAETLSEAARQHDAMIAAIETRDPTAAATLAQAHWALSRDEIERFVMPQGLDAPLGTVPRTAAQ
ncbi:GntR family transcriptional regulator [Aliiruegeria haliotis]|uniref:GntR family transcriptional regulator n=1 Tax=Aliiruegeria haliotis TaxID=1280846 RepID=A0A2T0RMZ9_9RHOB|nr:GntR family transcriptional regulator [Aliiruegeria haliotis]PRY22564.1 GntR family transcriptional regulator [Aliiruegeria haliotis]